MDVRRGSVTAFSRSAIAALLFVMLTASVISGAGIVVPAFAVSDPAATMNIWSPHLDSGNDGTPASTFTFFADATASSGLDRIEWDFNGDGSVDATSDLNGENSVNGVTVSHVFDDDGINWPQVRAIDMLGVASDWDRYQSGGNDVPLDVFWPPPFITMLQWQPFAVTLGAPITFSSNAFNQVGVLGFEWDFDGDGNADDFSDAAVPGAQSASGSIIHVYTSPIAGFPQVRALDNDGFVSPWDVYDVNGQPVQLVVATSSPPSITLNQWSPYNPSGPDGAVGQLFTFTATATSAVGIDRIEWDLNADGVTDSVTDLNGETSATPTVTYTYSTIGNRVPVVRVYDINGLSSSWEPFRISGSPVELETVASSFQALLGFVPRALGDVGPDGNTDTSFVFNATALNGVGASYAWDFDGDGTTDATTLLPTITHTYPVAGSYLPSVTITDILGGKASAVPVDLMGQDLWLDVDPLPPVATLNVWSPYSATGPDGHYATPFTFSASATAAGGVSRLEWDFDGNGSVDATTPISGFQPSVSGVTTTYTYGVTGTFTPQVRVVDKIGQTSPWDAYNVGASIIQLDIVTPPPTVVMNQWNPYSSTGPDGIKTTTFTFSADASADAGISKLEWDFDGNGTVDATSTIAGAPQSVTGVTKTFSYGTDGTFTPQVRVVDIANNESAWDALDIASATIQLDVVTPPATVTMNQWIPYSASGPDGTPSTQFTFAASGTSPLGVTRFEWDFDGNGSVDATTSISGSPSSATGTATYTYNTSGNFTPMVRVVDAAGITAWAPYKVGTTVIQLDISAPPGTDLYCSGKTIDQLIASGQYNVIDNRNGYRKTLNGTDGKDLILAGKYGDTINAKKGDDCVIGGAGDDIIHGHQGDDQIYGNGGNDRIFGDDGNDKLYGGSGNDVIYGDNGDDVIVGGSGNDEIDGGNGNDDNDGGDGSDGCDDNRGRDHNRNNERNYRSDHRDDDHDHEWR